MIRGRGETLTDMTAMGGTYLIKNGKVFQNDFSICKKQDILVKNGMIAAMAPMISETEGVPVINANGLMLSGGWVDSHVHVFDHDESIGVSADAMLKNGVTAVIDAGTAGANTFDQLYQQVISTSQMKIKAYLHIGKGGISCLGGELLDMAAIDMQACIDTCKRYPNEIIGLKVRIDPRVCVNEELALQKLRSLGDITGKRIVVHASRSSLPLERILSYFKTDDIFAHSYAEKLPGLLDENGIVKSAAWEAKRRGVIFDLSHGNSNFSFSIAEKALAQNFFVDTISTDIHSGSIARVGDMAAIMTKLHCLGMSLADILRRVTRVPAEIMELTDYSPELTIGSAADLTAFCLETGDYQLVDCEGNKRNSQVRFKTVFTIKDGFCAQIV